MAPWTCWGALWDDLAERAALQFVERVSQQALSPTIGIADGLRVGIEHEDGVEGAVHDDAKTRRRVVRPARFEHRHRDSAKLPQRQLLGLGQPLGLRPGNGERTELVAVVGDKRHRGEEPHLGPPTTIGLWRKRASLAASTTSAKSDPARA